MGAWRVTVVVENTARGRGVLGEHGLAYWIERDRRGVLFDTGQTGGTLLHNAEALGVDLASASAVVLSHGHYDHTGGLVAALERMDRSTERPTLFAHPAACQRRFSRQPDGRVVEVGMAGGLTAERLAAMAKVTWTERPTQALPGLFVTGAVPRRNAYEDTGGDFYLDRGCATVDPIIDDQAVFFDSTEGLVVLLGCAHAGVINTLDHIRETVGDRPVHAVIGGMHLLHASAARMERTVAALRSWGVRLLAPTHCTGAEATARLWAEFAEAWRPCPVGTRFTFPAATP